MFWTPTTSCSQKESVGAREGLTKSILDRKMHGDMITFQRPADTHHSTVYGNIFLLIECFITSLEKRHSYFR